MESPTGTGTRRFDELHALHLEQSQRHHEHEGDDASGFEDEFFKVTTATYLFVLCASLNSCNLGYDIGVSTEASKLIQTEWDLTNWQRQIFVGSINFWAIFGALFAHSFTDGYGRRTTFVVAALGFILGLFTMSLSFSYGWLLFGRALVGLGVGIGLAIDPLYISEISPAAHRGRLVTFSEIGLNLGIVLGFTSGLVLSSLADGTEWRVMFLSGTIMPLMMIALVLTIMPESPRWLVSKNRIEEAHEVLKQVYPRGWETNRVVNDIRVALEREKAVDEALGWHAIFHPTPAVSRMLLVGVGTAIAQQAVGIDAIQYYLLDVIEKAGIASETRESLVLIFLGCVKLVFIIVGGALFDRMGRRPLLLISLFGMAAALFALSLYFYFSWSSSTAPIFALAVYLAFFSLGMGPGAWLVASEVFTMSIRGKAMSLATLSNRVSATIMSTTFLTIVSVVGWSGFFFALSLVCLLLSVFIYKFLPETKGRSLEDMSLYFAEITGDTSILEAETRIQQHEQQSIDGPVESSHNRLVPSHGNEVI